MAPHSSPGIKSDTVSKKKKLVKRDLLIRIGIKIMVIIHISSQEQLKTLLKVRQLIFEFVLCIIIEWAVSTSVTLTVIYWAEAVVDAGQAGSQLAGPGQRGSTARSPDRGGAGAQLHRGWQWRVGPPEAPARLSERVACSDPPVTAWPTA